MGFQNKKRLTRKMEENILPRPVVIEQGNMFKLKVSRFRQAIRGKLS